MITLSCSITTLANKNILMLTKKRKNEMDDADDKNGKDDATYYNEATFSRPVLCVGCFVYLLPHCHYIL